nr:reverse transcriptase domain-containing protein [Tanacetum cinerariifolium]
MTEGSQTKDYPNFFSGVSNLFFDLREEDGKEGPMIIEISPGSQKPNGSCNHANNMAARENIVAGKDRKAKSKENPISSFHSSRNAKILSDRRNGHIAEQHDDSTRMHNGFRTREDGRKELCGLLRRNLDVFAWRPTDMTRVPRHIVEHRINIRKGCLPVRQKKRGQAPNRNKEIYEEVEKLVDARTMKEVHYHSWLSNMEIVKKYDGSRRMCVDFKDLNKACPKDGYPLPKIDWKVESLCESSPQLTIPKMFKERAKAKWEAGKPQQIPV